MKTGNFVDVSAVVAGLILAGMRVDQPLERRVD